MDPTDTELAEIKRLSALVAHHKAKCVETQADEIRSDWHFRQAHDALHALRRLCLSRVEGVQ